MTEALTANITPIQWIDNRLKVVTSQILDDGKEAKWALVHHGIKEMCFLCGRRGLTYNQFLALRKDVIIGIEVFEPLAKTYIELEEKSNVRTSKKYH